MNPRIVWAGMAALGALLAARAGSENGDATPTEPTASDDASADSTALRDELESVAARASKAEQRAEQAEAAASEALRAGRKARDELRERQSSGEPDHLPPEGAESGAAAADHSTPEASASAGESDEPTEPETNEPDPPREGDTPQEGD